MADNEALARKVEELSRRVTALEDELAIQRLVVRYGFAVDTGDAEHTTELFTEDTLFDVDGRLIMRGREGVRDMVLGERHQALLPNCAHTIGPVVVELAGEHATVTGYTRIYLRSGEGIRLLRLGFNRWELEKRSGVWRIARRVSRQVGEEEAQQVFRAGLSGER
ncbi:MAG TPA: nuclear transport factor 2 family protein [Candidatus Bathyarchaeia archaeon]|nr:nuclear transport factor 2 family protein [Candidatus Bathyarchaeia archaeon]